MSNPEKPEALEKRILKILAIEGRTVRELSVRCSTHSHVMRRIIYKMYDQCQVIVIGHKYSCKNKTAIFAPWQEGRKDLGIISKKAKPKFDPTKKVECYKIWGM